MKLINCRCSNCGAEMQVDAERKQVFCSYCGAKLIVDNESINITNRVIDEARLKEAEVRLRELEYAHDREMREETLRLEQRRIFRISLMIYLGALFITYLIDGLRALFPLILIFGGIALAVTRPSDRHTVERNNIVQRNTTIQRDIRYDCSSKSRVAALLICFFFGVLGGHYFYVGRIGMGILYLFTGGLFGIGWLIDIIRIACGTFTDRYGMYLRL